MPPDVLVILLTSRDVSVKASNKGLVFSLLRSCLMLIKPQERLGANLISLPESQNVEEYTRTV